MRSGSESKSSFPDKVPPGKTKISGQVLGQVGRAVVGTPGETWLGERLLSVLPS